MAFGVRGFQSSRLFSFFLTLPPKQCEQVSHGSIAQSVYNWHVRIYRISITYTDPGSLDISGLLEIHDDPVCCPLCNTDIITNLSNSLLRIPRYCSQYKPMICNQTPLLHLFNLPSSFAWLRMIILKLVIVSGIAGSE
jgi:hypothetical protein